MGKRKIAPKNKVLKAIKKVLASHLKVESQEELCKLVLRRLKREDKKFTLSPLRVKRIALLIPEIEVKAKTKRKKGLIKIVKCPICDSSIKPIKVKNLLNKFIIAGYKCTKCGYQSDLEAFIPMKYEFIWKEAKI